MHVLSTTHKLHKTIRGLVTEVSFIRQTGNRHAEGPLVWPKSSSEINAPHSKGSIQPKNNRKAEPPENPYQISGITTKKTGLKTILFYYLSVPK